MLSEAANGLVVYVIFPAKGPAETSLARRHDAVGREPRGGSVDRVEVAAVTIAGAVAPVGRLALDEALEEALRTGEVAERSQDDVTDELLHGTP